MPHLKCGDAGAIKDDKDRAFCFTCGRPLDGGPDDGEMSRTLAHDPDSCWQTNFVR